MPSNNNSAVHENQERYEKDSFKQTILISNRMNLKRPVLIIETVE